MITEERLTEILDSKFEKLRTELTSSFHKDIVKEVNKLTASISTIRGTATNALKKAKSCEERIVLLESAEPPDYRTSRPKSLRWRLKKDQTSLRLIASQRILIF